MTRFVEKSFSVRSIGQVESCYPDKFGTPRQPGLVPASEAFIRINSEFQPEISLQGLSEFSHLWLMFWFHENQNSKFHAKVHPPRLRGESRGVFATRSPHRPNPIGLSLVELVKIETDGIWVRGVDVISGTPVLDIKPYLRDVESKPEAKSGWTDRKSPSEIEVEWPQDLLQSIKAWQIKSAKPELQNLIEQTLRLDPRPEVYKGFENSDSAPYRTEHAVRFWDGDIHFRFLTPEKIQITKVIANAN